MRWIIRIGGALLVASLLLVGGLFLLPGDKIAKIAAEQISTHTGREFRIDGDVSVTYWPVLGVRTGPVEMANADWASAKPMLRAESLLVGVAAPDLLRGEIRIKHIAATSPVLNLESRDDGRGNWETGHNDQPATITESDPGQNSPTAITLEHLQLNNASVTYIAANENPVQLQGLDLTLRWPEPEGAANVAMNLSSAGQYLSLAANIANFGAFLDGAVTRMTVEMTAPTGTVGFLGRASIAGEAAGRVTIKSSNSPTMLAAFGVPGFEVPLGFGQAIDAVSDMTYTSDHRISLRDLVLELDGNHFSGAADIDLSDKPHITARLDAGALDFTQTSGTTDQGSQTASPSDQWSTDAIDASLLARADGRITFSAQGIRTNATRLGHTGAVLRLTNSRAVLELAHVSVFGGSLSGELVANNRNGLSVGGNLRADDIELRQAFADFAGTERISGKGTATVKFLGIGDSEDAIMRSLTGSGDIRIGRGVIDGIDLNRLMSDGMQSGGTTVFDSLTASYSIAGGNLSNEDLLLTLPNFKADGKGRVGLAARDIDYLVIPVALRVNSGDDFGLPVRFSGPWDNIKIRPDLEAILQPKVDVKLESLKEDVRDSVQEKLEQKLDVTIQDGEDAEDVLKERLEDKAKSRLLRLLDRD